MIYSVEERKILIQFDQKDIEKIIRIHLRNDYPNLVPFGYELFFPKENNISVVSEYKDLLSDPKKEKWYNKVYVATGWKAWIPFIAACGGCILMSIMLVLAKRCL